MALVEFLASIGLTTIIWYGGREVINGDLTIGGMFAFLIYIINMPTPLRRISDAIANMKLGIVAWRRINAMHQQSTLVMDGINELGVLTGKVELKNVSFAYTPDVDTLRDLNIVAKPGDIVAIVGPSGAGKSSFANLLLRFYDPVTGVIYVDDMDIRTLKMSSLRKQIGFIQQEPILFNLSILENIRYGRPTASIEEVQEAAKLADAHDFIMELTDDYNYMVSELGSNLSGGQRQRIAIARAIIIKPSILVLDEPTAALDTEAEQQVMQAIRKVSKKRTTFLITHRLSTLIKSDRVIYLVNGKIVEMGTHGELIAQGGNYSQAVLSEELRV
jgi:subfamily B ATP-binding cassette protein MsbA